MDTNDYAGYSAGDNTDLYYNPNDYYDYNFYQMIGIDPASISITTDGKEKALDKNIPVLDFLGKVLSGKSSIGAAGSIAGTLGLGYLANQLLGGQGGFKGYAGSIPEYTATRTMSPIPTTVMGPDNTMVPRRPGSGGITYFTPMKYTPVPAPAPAPAPAPVTGAAGGLMSNLGGYSDGGQLLRGPGDGVSDSIPATIGRKQPARLAEGEFVIPARIVSEIGNGSTEAGAKKLYAMLEKIKAARAKTKNIAADTKAERYFPR